MVGAVAPRRSTDLSLAGVALALVAGLSAGRVAQRGRPRRRAADGARPTLLRLRPAAPGRHRAQRLPRRSGRPGRSWRIARPRARGARVTRLAGVLARGSAPEAAAL